MFLGSDSTENGFAGLISFASDRVDPNTGNENTVGNFAEHERQF